MSERSPAPARGPAARIHWLSRGECPNCKAWDGNGDWDGHVELVDNTCPKCGGEYHGE